MGGFTPYEKCNMLCINRLQFHSPIYSAGGRVTGRVIGKVHRQGHRQGRGNRCGEEVWGRGVDGMSCRGLFIHHVDYKPRGVEHPSQTGIDLADSLCGFKAEMGLQSALSEMFKF